MYLVLKGTLSVLVAKEIKACLTEDEYILYLLKLKNFDEISLLKNCIEFNRSIFFQPDHIFEQWLLTPLNQKVNYSFDIYSSKLSSEIWAEIENLKNKNENDFLKNNVDSIFFINRLNIEKILKESTIENKKEIGEKKVVLIYEYFKAMTLKEGDRFGERIFNSMKKKRTATVITEEECYLGTIDKKLYDISLRDIYIKEQKLRIIYFLKENLIFHNYDRDSFMKKYYNMFILENIQRFDFLFKENSIPNSIYFIKNGEFEITVNITTNEIMNIIKELSGGSLKTLEDHEILINHPHSSKYLNELHHLKILIAKDRDIMGLNDMIINGKFIFSVQSISPKSEVYRISRKKFLRIIGEIPEFSHNTKKFEETKKRFFYERFVHFKDNIMRNFYNLDLDKPIVIPYTLNKERSLIFKNMPNISKSLLFNKSTLDFQTNIFAKSSSKPKIQKNKKFKLDQTSLISEKKEKTESSLIKVKSDNSLKNLKKNNLNLKSVSRKTDVNKALHYNMLLMSTIKCKSQEKSKINKTKSSEKDNSKKINTNTVNNISLEFNQSTSNYYEYDRSRKKIITFKKTNNLLKKQSNFILNESYSNEVIQLNNVQYKNNRELSFVSSSKDLTGNLKLTETSTVSKKDFNLTIKKGMVNNHSTYNFKSLEKTQRKPRNLIKIIKSKQQCLLNMISINSERKSDSKDNYAKDFKNLFIKNSKYD